MRTSLAPINCHQLCCRFHQDNQRSHWPESVQTETEVLQNIQWLRDYQWNVSSDLLLLLPLFVCLHGDRTSTWLFQTGMGKIHGVKNRDICWVRRNRRRLLVLTIKNNYRYFVDFSVKISLNDNFILDSFHSTYTQWIPQMRTLNESKIRWEHSMRVNSFQIVWLKNVNVHYEKVVKIMLLENRFTNVSFVKFEVFSLLNWPFTPQIAPSAWWLKISVNM